MSEIANTPKPPYVAVIFTSLRTPVEDGYGVTSDEMVAMAAQQPGYLGMESVRGPDGYGITVSYWADEGAVRAWKAVSEHRLAQKFGREKWYRAYRTRVCTVNREYGFAL